MMVPEIQPMSGDMAFYFAPRSTAPAPCRRCWQTVTPGGCECEACQRERTEDATRNLRRGEWS